jgi:hypothetical protein
MAFMVKNFNLESEKPQFIYKRNPLVKHAFQIFMIRDGKSEYEPVGEYTLLDLSEHIDLTEKKVMNLITLLNGRDRMIDLRNLTQDGFLFNIVPKVSEDDPTKIILRSKSAGGTSVENAVLILEKGVLHDSNFAHR